VLINSVTPGFVEGLDLGKLSHNKYGFGLRNLFRVITIGEESDILVMETFK